MKPVYLIACLLLASTAVMADTAGPKKKVRSTSVETVAFRPHGNIRLEDTFGEVQVEGWSANDVEITIEKSTRKEYRLRDRARSQSELDSVRVSTRIDADGNLVIETAFPARNLITRPLRGKSNIELTYKLKVPRRSNLYVRHDIGEVRIKNIVGHIEASARIGDIALKLPESERYSIDARVTIGDVNSDFGESGREHLLGASVSDLHHPDARRPDAHQVILRLGIGDIQVRKLKEPILYVLLK